jgi:hypothetical protein
MTTLTRASATRSASGASRAESSTRHLRARRGGAANPRRYGRGGSSSHTEAMQEAFGIVIFGVAIIASLVAVATLASSRRGFDERGANGLNDRSDRLVS